jgi:hypothetical protein
MFFLLRCVFWLGLVFYAMDWPGGPSAGTVTGALGEVAASAASAAVAGAAPAVRDLCLSRPTGCLALATAAAPKPFLPPAGAETTAESSRPATAAQAPAPFAPSLSPPLPPRRPHGLS